VSFQQVVHPVRIEEAEVAKPQMSKERAEGLAGLADRSSRPRHLYRPVAPVV